MLTPSVLVAEVGEPPDVAEAHGDRDAGEEEVKLVREGPPLCVIVLWFDVTSIYSDLWSFGGQSTKDGNARWSKLNAC